MFVDDCFQHQPGLERDFSHIPVALPASTVNSPGPGIAVLGSHCLFLSIHGFLAPFKPHLHYPLDPKEHAQKLRMQNKDGSIGWARKQCPSA